MTEKQSGLEVAEIRRVDNGSIIGHMAFDHEAGPMAKSFVFTESRDLTGIFGSAFQPQGHMNF